MSTEEWVLKRNSLTRNALTREKGKEGDSKLLVSLHSIEFSRNNEGYFQVADDIFFSNLLYLLYIKKVAAGDDFETAKEKVKSVLLSQLERKKYDLIVNDIATDIESIDSTENERKLTLLNRAITLLETDKSDAVYCNFGVPEVP